MFKLVLFDDFDSMLLSSLNFFRKKFFFCLTIKTNLHFEILLLKRLVGFNHALTKDEQFLTRDERFILILQWHQ